MSLRIETGEIIYETLLVSLRFTLRFLSKAYKFIKTTKTILC